MPGRQGEVGQKTNVQEAKSRRCCPWALPHPVTALCWLHDDQGVSCAPSSLHPRCPAERVQKNDIMSNLKSTIVILKEKEEYLFFCAFHI